MSTVLADLQAVIEDAPKEAPPSFISIQLPVAAHQTPAKQLSWFVRNFLWTVCDTTLQGHARRDEAYTSAMLIVTRAQAEGQITHTEAESIFNEIQKIEEQVYPGSSKI